MITGVGADIVEVSRLRRALARDGFATRVFTEAERRYCSSSGNPDQSFAGRFAAKEAAAKSLGRSMSWLDVEVLPDEHGKPVVSLHNRAAEIAAGREILMSISHCRTYAVAYAVAVSTGEGRRRD